MRPFLAGLLLLCLTTSVCLAQATGEVESIGFQGNYRPDCWTPMVVRLHPQTNEPGTYQLQVRQHDQEGDRPTYTRTITLNGADQARDQRFWMYFLPQPINHGLPDANNSNGSGSPKELQRVLEVFLCTAGGKQIVQLPITSSVYNLDLNTEQQARSQKLILAVTDGTSQIVSNEYTRTVGMQEAPVFITLGPKDLPEDPLGYEAVDAVIWFDSDPADLDKGGQHKLQALQDYVRFGGHLVICQPSDWRKTLNFGDLLPVNLEGVADKSTLDPLREIASAHVVVPYTVDSWDRPKPPFRMARATAKPTSTVTQWIDWKGDGSFSDATPFIVHGPYGLGEVTWVAQDLGNPAITLNATTGWPRIWDKVFGWQNDSLVKPANMSEDDTRWDGPGKSYSTGQAIDLGNPFVQGLNLGSKGVWLIFTAIAFFIVYWIVAGPGGYMYLATQKRTRFSWFFFSASAILATAVTVLVVKLVLRGPPEVRHLSFVRIAANQPAIVYSRFGLYVPRDGDQTIELPTVSREGVSYLSNFAEHPQQLGDVTEFPSPTDYTVPVRDVTTPEVPGVTVAYRSSLKKFQSRWIGDLPGLRLNTSLKLEPNQGKTHLSGALTNTTNIEFIDVYLAYNSGAADNQDWMLYVPKWSPGETIDIQRDFITYKVVGSEGQLESLPGNGNRISDLIADTGLAKSQSNRDHNYHWMGYLYRGLYRSGGMNGVNYEENTFRRVFPVVSLYDRLPPSWNALSRQATGETSWSADRFEPFHRGVRMLNASGAIAAGQAVLMATAQGPMPVPVSVNGDPIGGEGTVLYQFILPLNHPPPATPSTQPGQR